MAELSTDYKRMSTSLLSKMRLLPLYGAGFENLGRDGQPIFVPTPHPGPEELLCPHDAVGLRGSDCKVIRVGQERASIYRTMRTEPVMQGHEVALTVAATGENLQNRKQVRERYDIQPDISVSGVRYADAYGYRSYGIPSQFHILDRQYSKGRAATICCRSNRPLAALKLHSLNRGLVFRQHIGFSTAPGGRRVGRRRQEGNSSV